MSEKSTATQTALAPIPIKVVEPKTLLERFDRMYQAIAHRAFEMFERNGKSFGHELDDWLKAEAELSHPLHLQVSESEEALHVEAEIPGFKVSDVEVHLEPRRLTISGKKESSEERKNRKTVYRECTCGEVLRVIDLPAEIIPAKTTAVLKNGVLELSMPKIAKVESTRVEVKAA